MTYGLNYITTTLKGAAEQMSDAQRRVALECFEHYRGEWISIAGEDPARVAVTVHYEIDEFVRRMLETSQHGREVRCAKGCAACCHMHIGISPPEARLLLLMMSEENVSIDWARAERQASKGDATWADLAPEDRRCVFLGEDRACRVYEHRPGACRKYQVNTDPERCDMEKYPGGKVGIVFSVEAEIVHSAALTVQGVGSLASMLIRERDALNSNAPERSEGQTP